MPIRIVINGRKVTNPFAKVGIAAMGVVLLFGLALFVLFVVLPLIGLTLALTMGIILAVLFATLVSALLFSLPYLRRMGNDGDKRLPHDQQRRH